MQVQPGALTEHLRTDLDQTDYGVTVDSALTLSIAEFDESDRVESAAENGTIRGVKDVIDSVEAEYSEGAPVEIVLKGAQSIGMRRSKAEIELGELKQSGEGYEPSHDHLRMK